MGFRPNSSLPALVLALVLAGRAGAETPAPTTPPTDAPPRALACLAKWYPVEPVKVDGAWHFELAGTTYPWDDGEPKSFEEKLESPDLEDAFSIPYVTGPITPVTRENEDPGRIRLDALFHATYGDSSTHVDVVELDFLGQKLKVHRKVAPAFERVAKRLSEAVAKDPSLRPFLKHLGGTFVWRHIANTHRQSAHSYGVSLDLNVDPSCR